MELALTACQFCEKATFKYTCPKCNALYCSQSCFRKKEHKKCTSSFYNIFNRFASYSQYDRNDAIMRYVALKNSIDINNKTPKRAESESSLESENIWTNDDYVPPSLVDTDSDSDDDRYPYFDYAYDSNDSDSYDEGYELDDESDESDDSNNDGRDDRDVSNDNDNNNGDDSIVDDNDNDAGESFGGNREDSNVNDDENGYDLSLEVD